MSGKRRFTLVELMTAIAVFSIFMVLIIQFFVAAQRLWHATEQETRLTNKAALVFNTIERYVRHAKLSLAPFYISNSQEEPYTLIAEQLAGTRWEQASTTAYDANHSTKLVFVTSIDAKLHSAANGDLYIVGFLQVQDRILVRIICDSAADFVDLYGGGTDTTPAGHGNLLDVEFAKTQNGTTGWLAATGDEFGSGEMGSNGRVTHGLVDHVTRFQVTGYTLTTDAGQPLAIRAEKSGDGITTQPPYAILVELTLLGDDDYAKWVALCGKGNNSEPEAARKFRARAERSFSRLIFIGNFREIPYL